MATATSLSEADIIKTVVAKRNYQMAFDLFASKGSAQARELSHSLKREERLNQMRQAQRVWKEMSKQLAALIDEDKVVDTQFFGSFTKATVATGNPNRKNIVYCPGPRAVLKLTVNEDNIPDLSQQILNEKLTALSFGPIAEHCNTTTETVSSLLSGVRDEVVDNVLVKRKDVTLNFGVGTLNLRQGGFIEFRSAHVFAPSDETVECEPEPATVDAVDEPEKAAQSVAASRVKSLNSRKASDLSSQKSLADRNLSFMQSR